MRGRFAPSPTGPLHLGSLTTAVASYLDIKQQHGEWWVRIDDLDAPRSQPGATETILASLAQHGLVPDGPVQYQSRQQARYAAAAAQLSSQLFYCNCTRASLRDTPVYPGACRAFTQPRDDCATRLRIRAEKYVFTDAIRGPRSIISEQDVGDLIIQRRDGPWAYNFATAIDDGNDYQQVLRGEDLYDITPAQICIMHSLNLPVPEYLHIPLVHFEDGPKLSKQNHAPAIHDDRPVENLLWALRALGHTPPTRADWQVGDVLAWGVAHWQRSKIPPTGATIARPSVN